MYLFLASSVCVPTFAFASQKFSKLGAGIAAIWVVSLVLVILGESYAIPILYCTVICAAIVNVLGPEWQRLAADLMIYMITIVTLIELASMYYWVGVALNPLGMAGVLSEQLELNLTYSLYPVVMLMMFLLLFAWLWVPTISGFPRLRGTIIREPKLTGWNRRLIVASLDLCAILSLLVFFYPYLAGQTWVVGVDSLLRYLDPLNGMAGLSPSQAFVTSYQHGAYLMLLYLTERATGVSSFSIVKFAPLVLAFAMGSAVFVMMLRSGWGFGIAVFSMICSLFWIPTTLGFFTGIQANWIAFVFWMLFLSQYFLSHGWKSVAFVSQGLISLVISVMHPWTWGVFLATIVLTAIISWRSEWRKICFRGALAAVVFAFPVGIIAYLFLPGLRSDLGNTLHLYILSLQGADLVSWGGAYVQFFFDWGPFLSPLLMLICLVGAYSLAGREGIAKNYMMAWIAVWCVGSILVAPLDYIPGNNAISETQLWRMLYLSPLPILLALGMEKLLRNCSFPESNVHGGRLIMLIYPMLIVASMGLFFFSNPFARLAMLLVSVASMFLLTMRFPKRQILRILVVSVLVLVVVNVAYRSLYPLLLSPHNLIPVG